ncbi:MAG: hypothetical protein IKS85_08330 [Lachnospiraceae bacterium]|nr:hypothetical protein [Lachnospiraceae bacterium]
MAEKDDKELQQFGKRLRDLADRAYRQGLFTFTDFCGLAEADVFWQSESELRSVGYKVYGGRENADRVMIRFGNPEELGYETEFPIQCIHVEPLNSKFADDLSHRDFLGALMNLGIERRTLGDIIVGEKQAWLFCLADVTEFICENLTKVKHTNVKCQVAESFAEIAEEEPKRELLQVQSPRADSVIAKAYGLSREESLNLFRTGKVFIAGRSCENNSRLLKAGETVNARGFGKFVYLGEKGETRKGKLNVEVAIYR